MFNFSSNSILVDFLKIPKYKIMFYKNRDSFTTSQSYLSEKAMAPPLQYSCLENPMDGGDW